MPVSIGNTDKAILEALRQPWEEIFGQKTRIGDGIALSSPFYRPGAGETRLGFRF